MESRRVTQSDILPGAVKSRHLSQGIYIQKTIVSKSSAYTANADDGVILVSASSAAVTVTLPSAQGIAGRAYIIKKTDSSGNAVTIATSNSQTIDGATTQSLASQYKYKEVISDGSNWWIVANN